MIDREAVRANAKYLRHVRPIDPEEISDYVEGRPHPSVVRRTLREEAFDLELFEREDGTFVPAAEGRVARRRWRPERLPDDYADTLGDALAERYGPDWFGGESGDRLREVVGRLKSDYFWGNPVDYADDVAYGYAVYHLPDYYAAIGYVLDDLAERGLLGRRLRVLDVGAGVGGPALGLHDYLPEDALVEYHAVEPSDAAEILDRMLDATRRNFRTRIHRVRAEAFDPSAAVATAPSATGDGAAADGRSAGPFDLVLFCNVLSELDDPAAVVERYLDALADDGSAVLLAPADLETSTGLRRVERTVAGPDSDVTVYSPTLRLWPGAAPTDRGWSFDVGADVEPPAFQRRLDEAGDDPGTFVNPSVQFSYAILRTDGRRRVDVEADPTRHAKMAETERHVTERIDPLGFKLSNDLAAARGGADGSGGRGEERRNPLFKIGDGSERVDHYAVLTRESELNVDLRRADYGAVLAFENVLALWNGDEGAYNLVADAETVVDRVA